MGSSRLPGKVLRPIGDLPLLGHILMRLELLIHPAIIVVATSDLPQDDKIEDYCKELNILCFRGSEEDVLDRYYSCAKKYKFDNIVRLTADNPFTDIEELDRLISLHIEAANSFTHSFLGLPVGVGAEIFTFSALQRSWKDGNDPHHREHVDEYLLEHPEIFKTECLKIPSLKFKPDLRLTVDTEGDWQKANWLVNTNRASLLTTQQLIELCSESA